MNFTRKTASASLDSEKQIEVTETPRKAQTTKPAPDEPGRPTARGRGECNQGQPGGRRRRHEGQRWARGALPSPPPTSARAEARAPPSLPPPASRGSQGRPDPASQTAGRVAKGRRRPALPALPALQALTSRAAAEDRARSRAPLRTGPRLRSRPLGASGALSASKDFVIGRPRELCVFESDTEGKTHPLSLKPLLSAEESARSRHLVTRNTPSEPIQGKKKEKKTPASNYYASASEPQPPAQRPKGRRVSRGSRARPLGNGRWEEREFRAWA